MDEEKVSITKEEYEELLKKADKLLALESAGVDNWGGYDDAMDMLDDDGKLK